MDKKIYDRFEKELKNAKLSPKGKAVSEAVIKVLADFSAQNDEFRQAIEQSEKKIADCIKATVIGTGNTISDIEVYKKAVAFWFPGAKVKMQLTLDLGDGGFSNAPKNENSTVEAVQLNFLITDLWGDEE